MESGLAQILRPRVERLGYLGEFFQCAAAHPAALKSFYQFTEDLKKALPTQITEVVALTVSSRLRNAYERVQHERLSLALGLKENWIRDVLRCQPRKLVTSLSDVDRTVQSLVLSVLRHQGKNSGRRLDDVVRAIGTSEAIAVLMLIGRYTAHAQMVNCLDLEPPVASPLKVKNE
jgi:alkylhydroperoxidase family enzyme